MQRTTPPFRADHVGSLLRPRGAERGAREMRRAGRFPPALRDDRRPRNREGHPQAGRDRAQARDRRRVSPLVVAFRFLRRPRRRRRSTPPITASSSTACRPKPQASEVDGKIGFSGHPMLEHFKFLKAHTRVMPKMTIPAPCDAPFPPGPRRDQPGRLSRPRCRSSTISPRPTATAIRAFYDAGCRYLQLDDTAWSMMCDPSERAQSKARGDEPERCRSATRG